MTTSVAHATRGEIVDSLRTQPFGLVLALAGLWFAAWALVTHLRGKDAGLALMRRRPWKAWRLAVGVALAAWVVKAATHLA